jgi:hypothetical protein
MKKLTKRDFTKDGFSYPFWFVIDEIQMNINEVYNGMVAPMKEITFQITEGAREALENNEKEILDDSRWMFESTKTRLHKIDVFYTQKIDTNFWTVTFRFEVR